MTRPDTPDVRAAALAALTRGLAPVSRPFAALAEELGIAEDAFIAIARSLRDGGPLRRVAATLDARLLGYEPCVRAFVVPDERTDEVAALLAERAGVTHVWEVEDLFNLFFVLVAPTRTRANMVLDDIVETAAVEAVLDVPESRIFTLTLSFGPDGVPEQRWSPHAGGADAPVSLSRDERALARLLQGDLPLVSRPLAEIAATLSQCGFDVDERWVIDRLRAWLDDGLVRRFAGSTRPDSSPRVTALAAWSCPPERLAGAGALVASFPEVVHCFERGSAAGEPSALHSVVQGVDRAGIDRTVERIRAATGLEPPRMLYPVREFKRASMKYFSDAEC